MGKLKVFTAKQGPCWLLIVALCAAAGCTSKAGGPAAGGKFKFKPYYEIDQQLNGIPAVRIALPDGWKGSSRLDWNINAFYHPVQEHLRAEAADGESWYEFYGTEMFCWLNQAHDKGPWGRRDPSGAIHHPFVSLPEALARYVIAPNRRSVKNLKILGYRPCNLPKAFPHTFPADAKGNGICMRVSYERDGSPMEEEFFSFMPPPDALPGGPGWTEYHSYMFMTHSLGAKAGRLESARPLLGFIATSLEANPEWVNRFSQIHKAQQQKVAQGIARDRASIQMAKQLGAQAHASNEASIQRTESYLAQSRAQQAQAHASYSASSNDTFEKRADGFNQYLRGTEHMQDQNGVVSDQYTDYNYHWTDANGTFVHTNDPGFDPNQYLNGSFQQMTPVRK